MAHQAARRHGGKPGPPVESAPGHRRLEGYPTEMLDGEANELHQETTEADQ